MRAATSARRSSTSWARARFDFARCCRGGPPPVRRDGHRADSADRGGRHQFAAARARGARAGCGGRAGRSTLSPSPRRAMCARQLQARARRSASAGHRTFMSVAGLPARAVRTPWLGRLSGEEAVLQRRAKARPRLHAGLGLPGAVRPARWPRRHGQFCIGPPPGRGFARDTDRGLFFFRFRAGAVRRRDPAGARPDFLTCCRTRRS